MRLFRPTDQGGFTLIEIVIIIVVLGILAAVAIPKYQDITGEAKEAACRSSLGSLRSGITIYYANQAVTTGTATWPAAVRHGHLWRRVGAGNSGEPYLTNAPDIP
jgi:prepilin-type N-terminal cleavage/methylation domain-containing protein